MYYARIIPNQNIYYVCDVLIRTITDTYFVGMDKRTKQAYIFTYDCIDKTVFFNRGEASEKVLSEELRKQVKTRVIYILNLKEYIELKFL